LDGSLVGAGAGASWADAAASSRSTSADGRASGGRHRRGGGMWRPGQCPTAQVQGEGDSGPFRRCSDIILAVCTHAHSNMYSLLGLLICTAVLESS
jgi:hypothetical protein